MKITRGFQIKKRVTRFLHRVIHRRRASYSKPGSGVLSWVKRKAKGVLNRIGSGSGYERLGRVEVPKGHLAVYVGQKESDCCRVLVPVIYFNHPLFGRLLSEAEEKFGFGDPGRIVIPCPISEFERVRTKIQATRRGVVRPWAVQNRDFGWV